MIEFADVNIRQGHFELKQLSFSIGDGEYAVLMGQTGCGKTTLLECICGLRRVRSGKILIDGIDVTQLAPARREIGYVPQDRALFPTMRIDQQIEFGLLVRNAPQRVRKRRVDELAELTGISNLLSRYPNGLSGGESQRVALARALSFRPRLLCLDEPLSALDDTTKARITDLLKNIHRREKITVLHITHNIEDAQRLGTLNLHLSDRQVSRAEQTRSLGEPV